MNKMKKLLTAALLLGALASCGETPSESAQPSTPSNEVVEGAALAADLVGIAEGKTVYLSTVGQADSDIVNNVFKKAGLGSAYTNNNMLEAADVEEGAVVLLTLGSSSKGLGAAGVDEAHEAARAAEFAAAAEAGQLTLILFHVGGTPRRGTSSDPIIEAAFPGAAACFVVSSGNADGFFTNLATENDVDLYSIAKSVDLVDYAKGLFGQE